MEVYTPDRDPEELAQRLLEVFTDEHKKPKISHNLNGERYDGYFSLRLSHFNNLTIYFSGYPNNCGIVVLHGFETSFERIPWEKERHFWECVIKICKSMGYSQIQYTTAGYQRSIASRLKKLGFEKVSKFHNKRSGSTVTCWAKSI